ncbi:HD domain-containing phosphohydrolase [Terasakiella sp. A23]|uniref:HD domain-containing phosphohydrolase n=1 Tax=Terasakiella sp. FCG-A23 TaxID=3080561 RepID=UPI002955CB94|nr:HD domain-containing phosphohydrolase [Terasakiella sp. A23]MDV7338296.1 HD domain-containing phosphohydrolase [Terasakiella sp. A23]
MSFDLFTKEDQLLTEAEKLLADPDEVSKEEVLAHLQSMTKGYKRSLKESKRLVKMNDRAEQKLQQVVTERTKELDFEKAKLERLVTLGIAMAAERDEAKLLEMILDGAKRLANADGGSLYLRTDDDKLTFEIVKTDSLGFYMGGAEGGEVTIPPVYMYNTQTGQPNHSNVVSHAVLDRETVRIDDAYDPCLTEDCGFDFSGTRIFDEANNYKSSSFLTVPLMPRGGNVIGALQLINSQDEEGNVVPFSEEIVSFVEAMASQAAVALDNQRLMEAQRTLMDSFIELIAGAIDAKSPYTGGHCARVPELSQMLCKAASDSDDGIFADFRFDTDDEWREFKIGAWLHDCGKVTTPEYVVDKATKLETIYNRIHEVRTRFEVLRRDAEISYLKALVDGEDAAAIKVEFDAKVAQLEEDFAFVAESNVGGEFMSDDRLDRLAQIAEIKWTRYFDDRLGLSQQEEIALEEIPPQPLPVVEKLLGDKPDHVIPRQEGMAEFLEEHGFKMPVPDALYNKGELYNLQIGRGTLTEEERFKINEHIIQTILMLERLPFPKHMEKIPEYAGAHHETMIGTGYPRKLVKEQMSIPARIMAIADVFEALTAADRPYKKPKKLSEAVRIMGFMVKDQHLDKDIFQLFLKTGLHKTYGEMFLKDTQLDDVDIAPYLEG